MKKTKFVNTLRFRRRVQHLLLLLIIISMIIVDPMTGQIRVFAVGQWSLPKRICDGYYPSIVQLGETIWLAYTTAEGGANEVIVRSSNDGGLTWSSPRVVFEAKTEWVAWSAQGTTFLSSNGELWLAWHANRNPAGGTAEIWYTKSVDNGVTWSAAKKPYEGNAPWNGYGWPRLVEMQNKIWLFFTHTESSKYMTTSDRGISWSGPFEVTPYYSQKQAPMADYVNGEIWLVYTKWDAGPADNGMTPGQEIRLIKSSDGTTWSAFQKISNATAPYAAQSVALIKYYKGRVFVFFSSWADQKWGIYLTTSDDGTTWSAPERIVNDISVWLSSIAIIEDRLWLVYTSSDGEVRYTTYEEPDSQGTVPIWQEWWFWTIIALSIITILSVFTALRYRKNALTSKEKVAPSKPASKEYIVCPNCGAGLPADSKFCGKCGTSLE